MTQISFQSKDHEELLNIIDSLRSQGISSYIDLPQIIVCGDQSSGKSSVLEALSGIRFPTKDNLCTRFATELVLRRGQTESATITIIPDADRPDEERVELEAFEVPTTKIDEDFASIIEAAEKSMGLDHSTKNFGTDVLRVELCGPTQAHLTLVDLPGLFHAGNQAQSDTDVEAVKELVMSYMKSSRSVILAVVSAKNDYANQIVTKYARAVDPMGYRTLGIITKPDDLKAGSGSEAAFVNLAKNKNVHFRLGWHLLRNRDYETRHYTNSERDDAEKRFFSQGIWASLPKSLTGVGSLKSRLSNVLKDQILSELPGLIRDVEQGVSECQDRLARLGTPRGTLAQQRLYLLRVSQKFSSLITAAIQGNYADSFFENPINAEGYNKRLRAVTMNLLVEFTNTIDKRGHAKKLVEDAADIDEDRKDRLPQQVTREDFITEVLALISRTRGCELPGTFNPLIIGELFYAQAAPWQAIVHDFTERLLEAARTSLAMTLEYAADQATKYGILSNFINPGIERLRQDVEQKVLDLLGHQQRGHPITFNHYLTNTMQKKRDEEYQKATSAKLASFFNVDMDTDDASDCHYQGNFNVKDLLLSLTQRTQADMDRFACSEAINCMESYYKVAKRFMIDDYAVHCIEECLIQKLPAVFSPETAMSLEDSTVESIAAETAESKAERADADKKLAVLNDALRILHKLDRHNPREVSRLTTDDESEASCDSEL